MTAAPNISLSKSLSMFRTVNTTGDCCIPKYGRQREDFPAIPKATVQKLFMKMDHDMDGHISLEELQAFCAKSCLAPLTPDTVKEMFYEITERRGIVHKQQLNSALTLDEVYLCFKGKYYLDPETRTWFAKYRPFHEHWVMLLRTVDPLIYQPMRQPVVPQAIQAQYERGVVRMPVSFTSGFMTSRSRVADMQKPSLSPKARFEASIDLSKTDSFKTFSKPKTVHEVKHGYEKFTNGQLLQSKGAPHITFEAKEYFNRVKELSQTNPLWNNEAQNSIFRFIPKDSRPAKIHTARNAKTALDESKGRPGVESAKIFNVAMRQEDCYTTKARLAREDPTIDPYSGKQANTLKDYCPPIGRKDFCLRFKCPPAYNHLGISEHDRRPKEALERDRRQKDLAAKQEQDRYNQMLAGKFSSSKLWQSYIKLPDRGRQVGNALLHPLLKRDPYMEPVVVLARQMRDDTVFGKPVFRLYSRPLKPLDIDVELGGIKCDLRTIYCLLKFACVFGVLGHVLCVDTVSYTHLTLPTICSV
eukprot:TRINITY_DN4333_c0_g2_i3.p1 TRINITY_DN4333_c0_g2~~TRINITY_DN4333_c0_g2_i3.p1  ORF type:complete len:529 (-),score=124.75 TRINITY_DN4333_c0_g2_i3:47-1633(-)